MQNLSQIKDYMNDDKLDLERIVKDFTPYVKKIIDNSFGENLSSEDKEEIIADVFFVLWKNQDKLFSSLSSYIAGITRNLIREKIRKNKITYDISEYENVIEILNLNLFESEREEIDRIEKTFKNLNNLDLRYSQRIKTYRNKCKDEAFQNTKKNKKRAWGR